MSAPEVLNLDDHHIKKAAYVIKKGGIVVFPTESFYGIGADTTNEDAVKKVFKIKKRQEDKPILILIGKKEMLYPLVEDIPYSAQKLMDRFWPGALTIVFRASKRVLPILTAGTGKIGIRMSGNRIARMLSELSEVPITGTSANVSGRPPCISAEEVIRDLKGIDVVLDAGVLKSEFATTVIDVTEAPPKIIRKGLIPEELIKECLKEG